MRNPDIRTVAEELNTRSDKYEIGKLQDIRKTIKRLKRRPSANIFSKQTIFNEGYAFHLGGRTELQFNIGKDDSGGKMLRHGVAFSFETNQTLPGIDLLFPKVRLFNEFMRLYPDEYTDMRMWHMRRMDKRNKNRSDKYMPSAIPRERTESGVFVFLGKHSKIDELDYDNILADFDRPLPLYRYVESGGTQPLVKAGDDAAAM